VAFWFVNKPGGASPAVAAGAVSNQSIAALNDIATNESTHELRKLLVIDYHSTNEHDSITSLLTHQLIAERLRTNSAFLEWATNAVTSVIMRFVTNGDVPIYGTTGLTAGALQFDKVTAEAPRGLQARAMFDPHPTTEGPLVFIVEGGVNPTIQLVQNGYRIESYQLSPEYWDRAPRKIGRMDWSCAVAPLDKNQVDAMARNAFHEMTGLDLKSFNVVTKMDTEKILNTSAIHPEVTVTGNLNAKLFSPKDYVYPFATFEYSDSNFSRVPFSGEMVQSSSGRGEFVKLFAVSRNPDALFELGEKFIGQGTWEQNLLFEVRSMNTEERGQVYRRVFQH